MSAHSAPTPSSPAPHKLKRLPPTHRVSKRPPLRPQIPSPYTSATSPKIVYINTKTPFVSALKRTQKLLELVAKREESSRGHTKDKAARGSHTKQGEKIKENEEVTLKGTGRTIERALELGLWFQGKAEYLVRIRTSEVGVVDDIIEKEEQKSNLAATGSDTNGSRTTAGAEISKTISKVGSTRSPPEQGRVERNVYAEDELPESRIRRVSVVEVLISWRS